MWKDWRSAGVERNRASTSMELHRLNHVLCSFASSSTSELLWVEAGIGKLQSTLTTGWGRAVYSS